jgi:hypothetical protein
MPSFIGRNLLIFSGMSLRQTGHVLHYETVVGG